MSKVKRIIIAILAVAAITMSTATLFVPRVGAVTTDPAEETPAVTEIAPAAPDAELTDKNAAAPAPYGPTPSEAQMKYYKEEMSAFIHFSMSTYYDREWGEGTEDPKLFNPTAIDTDEWIQTLKDAGFKRTILTAKHHDGFNLYPTKVTDHSVKSAVNWQQGKGDVVGMFAESCDTIGMGKGIYLSPWDRNIPNYGTDVNPDYNDTYIAQMKEIFANYSTPEHPIVEFWMDGANGNASTRPKYDIQRWWDTLFELNPDIVFQQNYGAPIRWVGNEAGYASVNNWQTLNREYVWDLYEKKGQEDAGYLHEGAPYTGNESDGKKNGNIWSIPEVDVSIRNGWFYHPDEKPKSPEKLAQIYFESVGRGSPLLLNVPPDKTGKFDAKDVASLSGFKSILDNTFSTNFATASNVKGITASETRAGAKRFSPANVVDGNYDTYWTMTDGTKTGTVEVTLSQPSMIDVVQVQEYIPLGQRISSFEIEVKAGEEWISFGNGKTIGYKRLIQGSPVMASAIRLKITGSYAVPLINNISAYKADERIAERPIAAPGRIEAEKFGEKHGDVAVETGNKGQDGTNNIGWIGNGDYTAYNVLFNEMPTTFTFCYAGDKDVSVAVRLDAPDGPVLTNFTAPSTGNYFTWKTMTSPITYNGDLITGYRKVYLCMNSGMNVDWFEFKSVNTVEFEAYDVSVFEGKDFTVKLTRNTTDETAVVTVATIPATGVSGVDYVDKREQVTFAAGETEKIVVFQTYDNDNIRPGGVEFFIELSAEAENVRLSSRTRLTVKVVDNDSEFGGRIEAKDFDEKHGNLKAEQKGPNGGWNLGAIQNGDYTVYKSFPFKKTPKKVTICYSGAMKPTIAFRINSQTGPVLAEFEVAWAQSYNNYIEKTYDITYDGETLKGLYDLYLCLNSGINVAWFEFS